MQKCPGANWEGVVVNRKNFLAACFAIGSILVSSWVLANGVFGEITGDVNVRTGSAVPITAVSNQRFVRGSTVTTGPKSQAIMRFDDGHAMVLHENTVFHVTEYSFDRDAPQNDNIAIQLIKGAMRSVSGLLAKRSSAKYSLVTETATIGIRGTDFMVALVNPLYMSVLEGSIAATNAAGTAVFGAGATATVATATTLAVSIAASALPASVASAFSQMGSGVIGSAASSSTVAESGAGGGAGAGGAAGAAAGGLSLGAIAVGAAVLGVVAASTSNNNENNAAPSAVTGTTGTTGTR